MTIYTEKRKLNVLHRAIKNIEKVPRSLLILVAENILKESEIMIYNGPEDKKGHLMTKADLHSLPDDELKDFVKQGLKETML